MWVNRLFKYFSIGLLIGWLVLFALLPFLLVILASFLREGSHSFFSWHVTINYYLMIFQPVYLRVFFRSFGLALITSGLCLLLGYPFAFILSKLSVRIRAILMFLIIIPFWTSSLIRLYAMIIIVRTYGPLNRFLEWIGLIHHPLHILYTQVAVLIGLVYALLPFMILPLYANLEKFDWCLIEAARDLGAGRLRTLWKIVIPLTIPGIIAGTMLVLLPAVTMFYIPDVLGGARSLLLGNLIKNQFMEAHNWPMGSAVSIMLTLIMGLMLWGYWKMTTPKERRDLL